MKTSDAKGATEALNAALKAESIARSLAKQVSEYEKNTLALNKYDNLKITKSLVDFYSDHLT